MEITIPGQNGLAVMPYLPGCFGVIITEYITWWWIIVMRDRDRDSIFLKRVERGKVLATTNLIAEIRLVKWVKSPQ